MASANPTQSASPTKTARNNSVGNQVEHTAKTTEEIGLVTPLQLQQILTEDTAVLIDVRNPSELTEEGKISLSVNIPLPDVEAALKMSNECFKLKYACEKPSEDNCNLVFHCGRGGRSFKAAMVAQNLGYMCPKSLDGGFGAWKQVQN